jgi:hypothetical protein
LATNKCEPADTLPVRRDIELQEAKWFFTLPMASEPIPETHHQRFHQLVEGGVAR